MAHRLGELGLPLLDNLRVASPCDVDWARMTGDERVRACGECSQRVYNISSLTRDAAEALLREREHACVRFFRRSDGTILTADCEVGAKRVRRRKLAVAGAAVAVAGSLIMPTSGQRVGAAAVDAGSPEQQELGRSSSTQRESPPPPAPAEIETEVDAEPEVIDKGLWIMGLR